MWLFTIMIAKKNHEYKGHFVLWAKVPPSTSTTDIRSLWSCSDLTQSRAQKKLNQLPIKRFKAWLY